EAGSAECLMDGRRLVDSTGDRLKIVSIKRERVNHAVPADDIEGMLAERVARQPATVLDENRCVAFAVDDLRLLRTVEISLAVRGAEPHLAVRVQIAIRDDDIPCSFEHKQIGLRT